ncbi:MAG: P1 family peptidase [Alphaproteobacteria bacterium]|nr:P1 family peptidase [Alphaproteobacteria bacterium]HPF47738.1 P1 family peptidase [Emcibacteraceae bacterium]
MFKPGPQNLITDIEGISVGHAEDQKVRTGTTVLYCPGSVTGGVDVRGGGPGLRDVEVLSPENLVGRADAVVLSGGSVFGLAAGDGIAKVLSKQNVGLKFTETMPAVPIVVGAILFDLVNGGDKDWGLETPYHDLGIKALEDAQSRNGKPFPLGNYGAGLGARAGNREGGVGSTSIDLGDGLIVGALVAVNCVGSVYMPDGKTYWAQPFAYGDELGGQKGNPNQDAALQPFPDDSKTGGSRPGTNTTIGIIATSAKLTSAECKRVAMMAHDGYARAIRPVHTLSDGDTIFCISGGTKEIPDGPRRSRAISEIGAAAADTIARAIARGVYEAQ